MDINKKTFGKNLKKARETVPLTQDEFIEKLKARGYDISQAGLSHYEQGRRFPDPDLMAVMADVLEVSLDYLGGLTETTSPVRELLEDLAAASGEGKINKLLKRLSRAKQEQVTTFAEFLIAQSRTIEPINEFDEWVSTTEVLMHRMGEDGGNSFVALLASERPDLANALGIAPEKKSIQDR